MRYILNLSQLLRDGDQEDYTGSITVLIKGVLGV